MSFKRGFGTTLIDTSIKGVNIKLVYSFSLSDLQDVK